MDDVDVQLAAAFAVCSQNIRNYQNYQEIRDLTRNQNLQQLQIFQNGQFARNNSASHSMTSNSGSIKQRRRQVDQNKQISSQPIHLIPSDVDSRAVMSQPCSFNKQNRTWIRTPATGISISTKIAEWKNKLDHLSILFNSLCNGTMSSVQMYGDLDMGFRDLITFLCCTSSIKRPATIFALVEVYAGSLVKLHQYCIIGTDNDSKILLYTAIHKVMSFWLRFLHRNNLSKYDRFWLHTRAVITRMFRNIIIQECILAIKHGLASMLKELTMLILEGGEYGYNFYLCEQIEYLMTMLSHQTSYIS
ncbi:Demethyl-4-deoxygadusol synthase [Dirofilaria immitis]